MRHSEYQLTFSNVSEDEVADPSENKYVKMVQEYAAAEGVQEIIGAVKMYDANEAWVVTNSYFTKQAIKLAEINDVYLIDRDELIDIILDK